MVTRVAAVGVLLVLLLSGCTTATPPAPERTVPAPLPDRDAQTVMEDVAALDPCALLDADLTAELGEEGTQSRSLFSCAVGDRSIPRITVDLLTTLSPSERFNQEKLTVGGAVAYRSSTLLLKLGCELSLPVDHNHAIVFSQLADNGTSDCTIAERYAEIAAERLLADPASLARPTAANDAVDLCAILEAANGPAAEGTNYESGLTSGSLLPQCGMWRQPADLGYVPTSPEVSLELHYGRPLAQLATGGGWEVFDVIDLAGQRVLVWNHADDPTCRLIWDAKPAAESADRVLAGTLFAGSCDAATQLFPAVVRAFADAPALTASGDAVFYAAGESDLAVEGVCADVDAPGDRECIPWTGEPGIADDLLSRGVDDPNLVCAATAPAIQDAFDDRFEVVTVRNKDNLACEFVTDRHEVVVQAWASSVPLENFLGDEAPPIAGHPVRVRENLGVQRTTCVAQGAIDEPATLCVGVVVRADRSEGNYDGAFIDHTPLDTVDDLLQTLVPDLLGTA